jgi:hypothetical protein
MFTVVRSPVRGSLQTCGRWLGVAALTASSIAAVLIGFVNGEPAGAAVPTVGGTCGFLLGAPLVTGAAGSAGLEFPVYPANPHQVCQVKVTALASLTPVSGGSYSNVTHDPSSQTFTLDFAGGPLPLGILWQWSPHCADPVTPGVFTLTVNGQSSSSGPLSAPSCLLDLGGHSSLDFDFIDPADAYVAVGMAATTDGQGYWGVYASGADVAKGDAASAGFLPALNQPVVAVTADPTGQGYWIAAADGGVFSFGGAAFWGSLGGVHLNAPVVGMARTADGGGYWLVAADGGVFSFGDAAFHGSLGGVHLNAPVVGIAPTADGGGYWLVAADGGVFSFGDAVFHGSLGGVHLNAPVVGMAATPDGGGYWLAAYDGGVFTFGDAPFEGSAGNVSLAAPVLAMAATPSGHGYWLLGGDGGVFSYGDAGFFGAMPLSG